MFKRGMTNYSIMTSNKIAMFFSAVLFLVLFVEGDAGSSAAAAAASSSGGSSAAAAAASSSGGNTNTQQQCRYPETYSTCVIPCNNCYDRGNCNFLVCNKGCDCVDGYYRDDSGRCIPEKWCPPKTCPGKNEYYDECGTACPAKCSDSRGAPQSCTKQCVKGCFCKPGFVRNDNNECIKREQCPRTCPGKNEEYNKCGSSCFGKCSDLTGGAPQSCSSDCKEGCFCKEGYLRNDNNECIPRNECPRKCDNPRQQYYDCMPTCNNTCENYNPKGPVACPLYCKSGCACRKGLVLRKDGKCVDPSKCGSPPGSCPANEEFTSCGTACPKQCSDIGKPPKVCTQQCVPGCFCKEGYVRNDNGKCVQPNQCPRACPANEEYTSCGTACPQQCSDIGKPPKVCTQQCVEGCFCKKGYVRNDDWKCVQPDQCPTDDCCGDHETYSTCGSACEKTCSNMDKNIACTAQCVEGCFCDKGYVRNDNDECVRPEQCPGC